MDLNNVVNPWRGLAALSPDVAYAVARSAARAGQARLDRDAARAARIGGRRPAAAPIEEDAGRSAMSRPRRRCDNCGVEISESWLFNCEAPRMTMDDWHEKALAMDAARREEQ